MNAITIYTHAEDAGLCGPTLRKRIPPELAGPEGIWQVVGFGPSSAHPQTDVTGDLVELLGKAHLCATQQ